MFIEMAAISVFQMLFFNILTYRTAYPNIFLVTEENFDTKDNDFIRYKLLFRRSREPENE